MSEQTEEKKFTKQELFEKEPDRFVHLDELLMACKVTEEGNLEVLVNTTRPDAMGSGLFSLQRACNKQLDMIELARHQEKIQTQKVTQQLNKKNFNNFIHKGK